MNRKKAIYLTLFFALGAGLTLFGLASVVASYAAQSDTAEKPAAADAVKESTTANQQPINASRAAREEKAIQDARRQQLAEKEAILAAKEQELKKLSDKLDAQVKALEENRKKLDNSLKAKSDAKQKKQDEKIQKMVKLFKTLKGEQAGKFIDSLQENMALTLLSRMDTKAVAKLAPFISQPRILKWITDNLSE